MKKTYKLQDLDCANCARKMQDAIARIDGVDDVTVNFLTQKMTITLPEEREEEILTQAAKVCRRIEPDCRILF